ncbi:tetratricopeptide repeat protein [Streptomyces sp. DSM 44917]|uniref:Tetratricopeptide repeat protein n=1 Tax=Streptomyces boetiae TaxID=3075541 RepID=A0ABU2L9B0_9ACTN|nr:tetratricopeptide repeat protein [Streptomyces sp. DSM 44917]MDT0307793.1 tetratricopeptide repeat protein [Streptomyces sp. DSM 44917]
MDTSPNEAFRRLRGPLSQGEFAAAVRRAAREIGERVCCDARYIGRVESGEIRCPNYAYERVFLHMFPGRSLAELGFQPRLVVRRRRPPRPALPPPAPARSTDDPEEGDVLRRALLTGGPAAAVSLTALGALPAAAASGRPGAAEADDLRRAVRDLRLLDDRFGADALYRPAAAALRAAQDLLDAGARERAVSERLYAGAGELAISVGWLAHDSGRLEDARSHYAEALAVARVSGDAALEAHAFCNAAFLARAAGHPREAARAAQAGEQAARRLGSPALRELLALREAAARAALGDARGTREALARAEGHRAQGAGAGVPEWMSFFGPAESASQEASCWALLGDWERAARRSAAAAGLAARDPHFARNGALYTAELASHLAKGGSPEEAAAAGSRALALLGQVRSSRLTGLLSRTARRLAPARADSTVAAFLDRAAALPAPSPAGPVRA